MNGRIHFEDTPEGRLAAVAKSLLLQMQLRAEAAACLTCGRIAAYADPDYADFREALRPFVERELLLARIGEARTASGKLLTSRIRELATELAELNKKLPDALRLVP
jgi:hypothetical protein